MPMPPAPYYNRKSMAGAYESGRQLPDPVKPGKPSEDASANVDMYKRPAGSMPEAPAITFSGSNSGKRGPGRENKARIVGRGKGNIASREKEGL